MLQQATGLREARLHSTSKIIRSGKLILRTLRVPLDEDLNLLTKPQGKAQ